LSLAKGAKSAIFRAILPAPAAESRAPVLRYRVLVELYSAVDGNPRERGCRTVAEVKIQEGESIESALRRFKRKVQQEDIIKDIKKHSFYLKPGDKRRAKQALARKRSRKKQRRESD
jgi:small subunit ribosomal protein S21